MSTDDARGVERELLAEALHRITCSDSRCGGADSTDREDATALLASPQFARLIEQREAAARAEGRREVREAVERLLADGPDTWTGYESRDTGWTFLADSVLDFTADLRAVLAGQGGESGEGA